MTSPQAITVIRPLLAWYQYHLSKGGKIFNSYKALKAYVADNEDYLRQKKVLLVGKTGRDTLVTSDFGKVVYGHLFGGAEHLPRKDFHSQDKKRVTSGALKSKNQRDPSSHKRDTTFDLKTLGYSVI